MGAQSVFLENVVEEFFADLVIRIFVCSDLVDKLEIETGSVSSALIAGHCIFRNIILVTIEKLEIESRFEAEVPKVRGEMRSEKLAGSRQIYELLVSIDMNIDHIDQLCCHVSKPVLRDNTSFEV